jgi:hypothetical protein
LSGLRAEALDYHRRAGMPEAMVNDERSVIFMISGSMTQNKNAQVLFTLAVLALCVVFKFPL